MLRSVCVVLVSVCATVVASAPAASAKDKPTEPAPVKRVCNLLVDALGDTTLDSSHLDIRSGDVATTTSSVYAAVRVRSLSEPDTVASLGARWDFTFFVGSSSYRFTARRDSNGSYTGTLSRDFGGTEAVVSTALVKYDPVRGEILWIAPRKAVRELTATTGVHTFYGLGADTYAGPTDHPVDTAKSAARYLDGTPSCITP